MILPVYQMKSVHVQMVAISWTMIENTSWLYVDAWLGIDYI